MWLLPGICRLKMTYLFSFPSKLINLLPYQILIMYWLAGRLILQLFWAELSGERSWGGCCNQPVPIQSQVPFPGENFLGPVLTLPVLSQPFGRGVVAPIHLCALSACNYAWLLTHGLQISVDLNLKRSRRWTSLPYYHPLLWDECFCLLSIETPQLNPCPPLVWWFLIQVIWVR